MRLLAPSFLALVILAGLAAPLACGSDQTPASSPTPPAGPATTGAEPAEPPAKAASWIDRAPDDVVAVGFLPDGTRVSQLMSVVSAIDPSAAQAMPMLRSGLDRAIATQLGAHGSLSLDPDAALRIVVLNPNKHAAPLVFVGSISGEPSSPGALHELGPSVAAAGAPSAVAVVADWLEAIPEPARLRAVLLPDNLIAAFGAELDAMTSALAATGSSPGASLGPLIEIYLDGVRALAGAASHVEVLFESGQDRGTVRMRFHARPETLLARTFAAQGAADLSYLRKLPLGKRSMVMQSSIVAGPARSVVLDFVTEYTARLTRGSSAGVQGYTEELTALFQAFTGRTAAAFTWVMKPGAAPVVTGAMLMELETGRDAAGLIDRVFEAFAKTGGTAMPGVQQSVNYRAAAGTHKGIRYGRQQSTTKVQGSPPVKQTSHIGVVGDDSALMVMGAENAMRTHIDALLSGVSHEIPAAMDRAVALAQKRGSTFLLVVDPAALGAAQPGVRLPRVGLTLEFDGPRMDMSVDLLSRPRP